MFKNLIHEKFNLSLLLQNIEKLTLLLQNRVIR